MFKILALNDGANEEEHQEDETIETVTKEAQVSEKSTIIEIIQIILLLTFVYISFQETIAVSEYMRALQLKHNGKNDYALGLFEDLLRTEVVSDVNII